MASYVMSSEYHDKNEGGEDSEAGDHHPQGDTGTTEHQQEERHEQRPTEGTHQEGVAADHTQQPVVVEEVHTQVEPSHGGATDQPEAQPTDGTPDPPAAQEHPTVNTEQQEGQQPEQEHHAV